MKEFSKGDSVKWKTSQGETKGMVVKKIEKPVKIEGHTAKASESQPQYIVETDKSHKKAAHKPDALKKC